MQAIFKRNLIPYAVPELELKNTFSFFKNISRGNIHKGGEIEVFEKEFAAYIGVPYAITFSSARYALYLLYTFFKCKNKKVIVPAYTCIPAIDAVRWANAIPFFVDIELNTYNPLFDPKIKDIKDIGALCLSYLYGLVGDHLSPIIEFSQRHHIPLIEDAAIAIGGTFKGKKVGSLGDAAVFSLQSSKILTAWKGGIVTTHRKDIYEFLLSQKETLSHYSSAKLLFNILITHLRSVNPALYGLTFYPIKSILSSKTLNQILWKVIDQNPTEALSGQSQSDLPTYEKVHFTNIQASLVRSSLEKIDSILDRRRSYAKLILEELKNQERIAIVQEKEGVKHAYGRFPIRIPGISKFKAQEYFLSHGIEAALNYPYLCSRAQGDDKNFPNAWIASQETFLLPFHTALTEKDIHRMIRVLKTLCSNHH